MNSFVLYYQTLIHHNVVHQYFINILCSIIYLYFIYMVYYTEHSNVMIGVQKNINLDILS